MIQALRRADWLTAERLRRIAEYADGVGPHLGLVLAPPSSGG